MESHVLNHYHQVKYRLHPINRAPTRTSSTDSGHQTSPEYNQVGYSQNNLFSHSDTRYSKESGVKWHVDSEKKMTETKDSSESDEEDENDQNKSSDSELIEVESYDKNINHCYSEQYEDDSGEEYEVTTIANHQFLEVYAIDPNAQLSSDEDERDDESIENNDSSDKNDSCDNQELSEEEDVNEENQNNQEEYNLESHVVTHIDEYFVKEKKSNVNITNGHVVEDLDDYFIKENKINSEKPDNGKVVSNFHNSKPIVNSSINESNVKHKIEPKTKSMDLKQTKKDTIDPEILPHIENIKRFLLEGMPGTKTGNKSVQRSCSLPHSPAHLTNLEMADVKTSISFEDLNLNELNDFPFDVTTKNEINVKTDDLPQVLTEEDINGFFVGTRTERVSESNNVDDFRSQDMEIDCPVKTKIQYPSTVVKVKLEPEDIKPVMKLKVETPNVLEFCKEKQYSKLRNGANNNKPLIIKMENDEDDVDVESFADNTILPVLEANNLSSLLEQFEATEKLNKNVEKVKIEKKDVEIKHNVKPSGLVNGTRLQVAALHLSKTKLRQIKMSSTLKTAVTPKSDPTVHSDHDYCSPEKRRNHTINIKAGQSLLKPEVLSSNNKILSSRHRSCKDKKVVYSVSSDDEMDVSQKTKPTVKSVKNELHSNHRKKHSPTNNGLSSISSKPKSAISVISKNASKASDIDSQSSSGSIKLTIKNKSKVILKLDCDDKKDSHTVVHSGKKVMVKSNSSDLNTNKHNSEKTQRLALDINKPKVIEKPVNIVKKPEETRPAEEDFYINLFNNKDDVQLPTIETSPQDMDPKDSPTENNIEQETIQIKQPQKKKLNLQEYKMRKEGSVANSRTVSPESIFDLDKSKEMPMQLQTNLVTQTSPVLIKPEGEIPQKIFDPITEASRKILMNTQKQIAKRQRYEDIVMTKIPKVENLELQPLISDAEMLKMVDIGVIPKESLLIQAKIEKPKNSDYEEIILVSVGTNTDQKVLRMLKKEMEKVKLNSTEISNKSAINFKIKSDKLLKQNIFDSTKDKKINHENIHQKRQSSSSKDNKMNKERFKDITATIKRVEKNSVVKISSNSLFASIQDVVMKKEKALDDNDKVVDEKRKSRSYSPLERTPHVTNIRTKVNIVREYDGKEDHGEDKVILHLEKNRVKPATSTIVIQTEESSEFGQLKLYPEISPMKIKSANTRLKSDSESSSNSCNNNKRPCLMDSKRRSLSRPDSRLEQRRKDSDKRSRSRERYKKSRRRSRSRSIVKRSRNRSYRSRSVSRYRRDYYRRSISPYRRNRRSRSHYRKSSHRFQNRSHSRSRKIDRSRSPVVKKLLSPEKNKDKNRVEHSKVESPSRTPPLRKLSLSESSDCSSLSTSSSSSEDSSTSSERSCSKRRRSLSPEYHRPRALTRCKSSFNSEDHDGETPVEERRIVFVGKLDKDTGKSKLRSQFSKFGYITNITMHVKGDGSRYGFVTFDKAREAFMAVGAASSFPNYDVGFGGRRAFCRERYADLDEEPYMTHPIIHNKDVSFEEMLSEIKDKLIKRNKKTDGDLGK